MSKIINPNTPQDSVGSVMRQLEARCNNSELVAAQVTQGLKNLLQQTEIRKIYTNRVLNAIVTELKLKVNLDEIAEGLNEELKEQAAKSVEPEAPVKAVKDKVEQKS